MFFLFTFIYTNLIRISLTEYLVEFLTIEVVVRQGWNHFLPEALQRHDLRQHRGRTHFVYLVSISTVN